MENGNKPLPIFAVLLVSIISVLLIRKYLIARADKSASQTVAEKVPVSTYL